MNEFTVIGAYPDGDGFIEVVQNVDTAAIASDIALNARDYNAFVVAVFEGRPTDLYNQSVPLVTDALAEDEDELAFEDRLAQDNYSDDYLRGQSESGNIFESDEYYWGDRE